MKENWERRLEEIAYGLTEDGSGDAAASTEGGDSVEPIQTPENLREEGFPRRHVEKIREMHGPSLEKAEELQGKVESRDCLMVLCGRRGPGKTQMATFWAQFFKFPAYYKTHDLIRAIRGEFAPDEADRELSKDTLKRARLRDYLVLDEFHELAGSDYERRTIVNIIDHRYDQMKATILITNAEEKDLAKELGASIVSRCRESGGVVSCNWESYR